MNRFVPLVVGALLVVLGTAGGASAQVTPLTVEPTPADTDSVLLLHGAFTYPGYWWDHTELTAAVQAHPKVSAGLARCRASAIADWNAALEEEFGGLITLTDVTDQYTAKHKADIVLHYNPTAGGTVFGGYAICGRAHLPERDGPLGPAAEPRARSVLAAVPVLRDDARAGPCAGARSRRAFVESTDLMGYGWSRASGTSRRCPSAISRGFEVVFAWAMEGVDPYPSTDPRVFCHD